MKPRPLEQKRGRKLGQVLAGARDVFLRDGFDGAAVDDIARAANVSKATLYSYFPDKRLLFLEVAKTECRRQADEALQMIDQTLPVERVLREAARRMVAFLISDFGLGIFRVCVAEADRFPGLGQQFYDSGPMMVRAHLVEYLRAANARGEVQIDDLELAADQFHGLCKVDIHDRALFGICCEPASASIDRVVEGAVQVFLARYGAR